MTYKEFINDLIFAIFKGNKFILRYIEFDNENNILSIEFEDGSIMLDGNKDFYSFINKYKDLVSNYMTLKNYLSISFNNFVRMDNENQLLHLYKRVDNLIIHNINELKGE